MATKAVHILLIISSFANIFCLEENTPLNTFYLGVRHEDDSTIPCTINEDCEVMSKSKYSKCINGSCSCPQNATCYQFDDIKVTILGEKCNESIICHIDNAHCFNNTCVCQDNFVGSASKKTCLEGIKKRGESCVEDIQCYSHYCHQNICSKHIALGQLCHSTTECNKTTEFSYCNEKRKCACLDRYVASNGKCYLTSRDLLSPCEVNAQCMKILGQSAECREGKCVCPDGYNYEAYAKRCISTEINGSSIRCITFKVIISLIILTRLF